MSKLQLLEHPTSKDIPHHMLVMDFDWGKVTIENASKDRLNNATAVYMLELAKHEILSGR